MGGSGSGRHWGCGRATIEDGLTLDINKLVRDGNIRPAGWCSGTLRWTRVTSGEEVGSIGYEANLIDPDGAWVRLHYRQDGEPRDYRVRLETTRPNYGGRRWWFRCPATGHRTSQNCTLPRAGTFSRAEEPTAWRTEASASDPMTVR